jgi:hypothetical protein
MHAYESNPPPLPTQGLQLRGADLGTMNTIVASAQPPILNDNGVGNDSFMHKRKLMERLRAFRQRRGFLHVRVSNLPGKSCVYTGWCKENDILKNGDKMSASVDLSGTHVACVNRTWVCAQKHFLTSSVSTYSRPHVSWIKAWTLFSVSRSRVRCYREIREAVRTQVSAAASPANEWIPSISFHQMPK